MGMDAALARKTPVCSRQSARYATSWIEEGVREGLLCVRIIYRIAGTMMIRKHFSLGAAVFAAMVFAIFSTGCLEDPFSSSSSDSSVAPPDSRTAFGGVTVELEPEVEIEFFHDGRYSDSRDLNLDGSFEYFPGVIPRLYLFPDDVEDQDITVFTLELSDFQGSSRRVSRFDYTVIAGAQRLGIPQSGRAKVLAGNLVPGPSADDSDGHDLVGLAPESIERSFITITPRPVDESGSESATYDFQANGFFTKVNDPGPETSYEYIQEGEDIGRITYRMTQSEDNRSGEFVLTFTSETQGSYERTESFDEENGRRIVEEDGSFSIRFY